MNTLKPLRPLRACNTQLAPQLHVPNHHSQKVRPTPTRSVQTRRLSIGMHNTNRTQQNLLAESDAMACAKSSATFFIDFLDRVPKPWRHTAQAVQNGEWSSMSTCTATFKNRTD